MHILLGMLAVWVLTGSYPLRAGTPYDKIDMELKFLEKSCRDMLVKEMNIRNSIDSLQKRIAYNVPVKPNHNDRRAAVRIAREQGAVVGQATRVLRLLEKDAAVAFPEVFRQLRDDMRRAQIRLKRGDISRARRNVNEDAIEVLREMLSALVKGHTCR